MAGFERYEVYGIYVAVLETLMDVVGLSNWFYGS